MRKVGFGVIGTGFWGRNHARVLSELDNTRLIAVCDVDASRAEAIGKKHDVYWCSSDEDLLKMRDVEAVCICTPTMTHAKIALKSIQSGRHVLIEKPMASMVSEAQRILKEAEGNDVRIMVGFIERFNPTLQRVKQIIERGDLGEIVLAFAKRVGRWPERVGDVGVVKDSAIHDLDSVSYTHLTLPTILLV